MRRIPNIIVLLLFASTITCLARDITREAVYHKGGIVRLSPAKKNIMLAFTCADMADGATTILSVLRTEKVHAAFFLTGNFIEKYPQYVEIMKKHHHYIGSHSYAHPLYSSWEQPDVTSISKEAFCKDIAMSFTTLAKHGIKRKNARYFMPPYEHYNDTISAWSQELGLQLINFTAGSTSNADYTTPEMKNYRSSDTIFNNILHLEEKEGLNGHILLFHIGTVEQRTDKFYRIHLQKLIQELKYRGYKFVVIP